MLIQELKKFSVGDHLEANSTMPLASPALKGSVFQQNT